MALFLFLALPLITSTITMAQEGQILDFTLPTVDGGELSLSQFRGRVVLLDFFTTSCQPCKYSMPKLDELRDKYQGKGLSVIGYALDQKGQKKVRRFVAQLELKFPVVLGNLPQAQELAQVEVVPTTLVIGPDGRRLARYVGPVSEQTLLAGIRPYLKSSAPPEPKAALADRHESDERRFRNVIIDEEQVVEGERGVTLAVNLEVADLAWEQGLWLAFHLQPEARDGSGLVPVASPKIWYYQVRDSAESWFVVFLRCDQIPTMPYSGAIRAWVELLGPNQKPMEKSGEFILKASACLAARAE